MAQATTFTVASGAVVQISSGTVNTIAYLQCRRGAVEIVVSATEPAATVEGLTFNSGDTVTDRILTDLKSGASASDNIYAIGRAGSGSGRSGVSSVRIDHS